MNAYKGSCHCGAIGFTYCCDQAPSAWTIRACQCRFCRAHDALSASDPAATITLMAREPEFLHRYRFGLRTADFLLCRRCGVYIGALIETPKGHFGIINTHALTNPAPDLAAAQPMEYGEEQTEDRVLRREDRWAPATDFPK